MSPTKCLSSYMTTELLKFRNFRGGEENWFNDPDAVVHDPRYYGRVVATEIGVALLCVTAAVESVAYAIFFITTIPMLLVSKRPCDFAASLMSSSSFTLYWNFANLTYFNVHFPNIFTQESFARYAFDHLPQGMAYQRVYTIAVFVYSIGLIIIALLSRESQVLRLAFIVDPFPNRRNLRAEDILFIAQWARRHQVHVPLIHGQNGVNPLVNQLIGAVGNVNTSIDEGAAFIKEFILDSDEVDEEIKNLVLDYDAEIYTFVATRSIYIYVFGSKRDANIPDFFKFETKGLIEDLRQKYTKEEGADLKPLMESLPSFNAEFGDDKKDLKEVFNALRNAAYGELQNSLFVTKCWEKACA